MLVDLARGAVADEFVEVDGGLAVAFVEGHGEGNVAFLDFGLAGFGNDVCWVEIGEGRDVEDAGDEDLAVFAGHVGARAGRSAGEGWVAMDNVGLVVGD